MIRRRRSPAEEPAPAALTLPGLVNEQLLGSLDQPEQPIPLLAGLLTLLGGFAACLVAFSA